MSIFRRLFGTDKAISDITDKDNGLLVRMGGWVDGLSHTEQEKSEAARDVREWGIRQLEALEPFKVVQRILAFGVTLVWAFAAFNVIAAIWVRAIWPSVDAVEDLLRFALSDYVSWPALAVLSLYFSGGVFPQIFGGRTKKSN